MAGWSSWNDLFFRSAGKTCLFSGEGKFYLRAQLWQECTIFPWALLHWKVRVTLAGYHGRSLSSEGPEFDSFRRKPTFGAKKAWGTWKSKQIYLRVNTYLKKSESCPWRPYLPYTYILGEGECLYHFLSGTLPQMFYYSNPEFNRRAGKCPLCWRGSCSETRLDYRNHQITVAKWIWTTHLEALLHGRKLTSRGVQKVKYFKRIIGMYTIFAFPINLHLHKQKTFKMVKGSVQFACL